MNKGTVYVVDDDPAVRRGIRLMLSVAGFPVEVFERGEDLLRRNPVAPGCVILDMRLDGLGGLDVLAELRRQGSDLPVIILTGYGDIPTTVRAMRGGATDFLTKPVEPGALIARVEELVAASAQTHRRAFRRHDLVDALAALTTRERQVLDALASGLDTRAAAQALGISPRTVEVHRSNIVGKTRVGSLAELYRECLNHGLAIGRHGGS